MESVQISHYRNILERALPQQAFSLKEFLLTEAGVKWHILFGLLVPLACMEYGRSSAKRSMLEAVEDGLRRRTASDIVQVGATMENMPDTVAANTGHSSDVSP